MVKAKKQTKPTLAAIGGLESIWGRLSSWSRLHGHHDKRGHYRKIEGELRQLLSELRQRRGATPEEG